MNNHNHFHTIFKSTGWFHWCEMWKHFVVCGQLCCSSKRDIISMARKICALYMHCKSTLPSTRTGYGNMATGWEGCWLQFIHIYDNGLAILDVSSTDELCDDCEGGGSNGKEEEGDKCDLDRVLLQPMLLMKLFFHAHSIDRHNRIFGTWNRCHFIWNISFEIVDSTDYFMIQSDFNAGINIAFYVWFIFVRLSVKYNIFSCCLLLFLTYLMFFPKLSFSCTYYLLSIVPSDMMDRGSTVYNV